jgi:hypothetical protein
MFRRILERDETQHDLDEAAAGRDQSDDAHYRSRT